jgi:hypothetical protein
MLPHSPLENPKLHTNMFWEKVLQDANVSRALGYAGIGDIIRINEVN